METTRGNSRPDSTKPAIFVAGAFITGSGIVDFAHKNHRPVHGGVLYASADTSARAARRRIEQEARRLARAEAKQAERAARLAYHREGATLAAAFVLAERKDGQR